MHKWVDGRVYMGEWKDNKMDGFGVQKWKGDNVYVGYYSKDKKEGYGKYYWADGREFLGWWSNNQQLGLGKYVTPDGTTSFGLWEKAKRLLWFTPDQTEAIKHNKFDYTRLFQSDTSKTLPMPESKFEAPAGFEERVQGLAAEYGIDMGKLLNKV